MARRSFTFFEARSINFAIVVQSECMRIEEKEVTLDENLGIRIASEVRYTFATRTGAATRA
jgi:hypothetical protein